MQTSANIRGCSCCQDLFGSPLFAPAPEKDDYYDDDHDNDDDVDDNNDYDEDDNHPILSQLFAGFETIHFLGFIESILSLQLIMMIMIWTVMVLNIYSYQSHHC